MVLMGVFAEGILILTVACWIFLVIEFTAIRQTILALLLLVGFLIPSSIIIYYYRQSKKKGQNERCGEILTYHED
jgi:preprotein translocase subunit SecF